MVLIGSGLLLWGQSRSFGSIQQALVPDKDTVLVDALRAKSRLNRGPKTVAIWGGTAFDPAEWPEALQQSCHRHRHRCG